MKKRLLTVIGFSIIMFSMCVIGLFGCGLFGGNDYDSPKTYTPKKYTIQYSIGENVYQIEVASDMPYKIDKIPTKAGYTFTGLFDDAEGGTQYVDANGASLTTFNDKKNLVLFPQFTVNQYKFVLDYQDADVIDVRQFDVSYGSSLPDLPKNLSVEHKVFNGWYTEENCNGVKVADKNGLIPIVSIVNFDNFDLDENSIVLYAGFENEKYNVTLHFGESIANEVISVEHGTSVRNIAPKTRVNGNAPLLWSRTEGGVAFNGTIERAMDLYALEFAPVIELELNGGYGAIPVVARAGEIIQLPTPTKPLAQFLFWKDENGNEYDSTVMPSESISIEAVWQGKLVFDENGGSNVDDISVSAGETISLPLPERDGYVFAGWYKSDKTIYSTSTMPATGIKLKAGWYKANSKTVVYKSGDDYLYVSDTRYVEIDLSEENPQKTEMTVNLKLHFYADHYSGAVPIIGFSGYNSLSINFHSLQTLNSAYDLGEGIYLWHEYVRGYREYNLTKTLVVPEDKIYVSLDTSTNNNGINVKDFYIEVNYPDTSTLYL